MRCSALTLRLDIADKTPSFNPIAATYMRLALKSMLDRHFSSPSASGMRPTNDVLDVIVESSNGDIRSAIMALQFACTASQHPVKLPKGRGTKKNMKTRGPSATVMLEAITRREQSLALFHLLGKIMYNKSLCFTHISTKSTELI